jgi:phosphopantetheinyl transferase (holo-ACP synthase)
MYKFTSGPWKILSTVWASGQISQIKIGVSREGIDYATAMIPSFGASSEANAALVAAAPDLLEALVYARNIIDNHVKITMQTKNAAEALASMVAIDEAIDKALGVKRDQDLNDDSKDIKRGNNAAGREYIERRYDMADLERKRDKGE